MLVMLLSPWPRLFAQHDAAEFMPHMLQRLRLPSIMGRWETRKLEEGRDLLRDEGSLSQAIPIAIQGQTSLADGVQAWHAQSLTHAPAPLLRIDGPTTAQVSDQRGPVKRRSSIRKDLRPIIDILHPIRMPQFRNSTDVEVSHSTFEVIALLLHRGNRINSGHYVCIWGNGDTLLLLDDACTARTCSATDLERLSTDAYLIWYRRRQASISDDDETSD